VGGLVTTTNSGMAFRDWLTSDGHFMLFYPWFQATGEKFIEHGHRLLGAVVGFLAIGLVLVSSRTEPRRWVRRVSWAILVGVLLQGFLGGMRVVFAVDHDNMARALALLHGCTGPLFFALCVAMVVFTSCTWYQLGSEVEVQQSRRLGTAESEEAADSGEAASGGEAATAGLQLRKLFHIALITSGLAYGQLVLGAVVRHTPHMTGHLAAVAFQMAVYFHLLVAGLLLLYGGALVWCSQKARRAFSYLGHSRVAHSSPGQSPLGHSPLGPLTLSLLGPVCLAVLLLIQIGLGASTWYVKYGIPAWATSLIGERSYLNRASDLYSVVIVTSHVAVGALIAVTALSIALLTARPLQSRSLRSPQPSSPIPPRNSPGMLLAEVAL
jgi:cytochrome c oxidase assembly protein subunit 15